MLKDEDLCREIQSGSETALEALVHRYHSPIYGYISRQIGDAGMSQDLVQETFIRVCTKIEQYRYPEPFRPWIYRIALNLCRDYWKSAYYRQRQQTEQLPETATDGQANISSIYDWQETRMEVRQAILELKEMYRDVLILRFYQELKLGEISDILQLPLGTVKWRLFKALELVKNQLAEGGVINVERRESDN